MNETGIDLDDSLPTTGAGIQPNSSQRGSRFCRAETGNHILLALKVFLLLLLLALPRGASGEPVSTDQARDAVIGWLRTEHSPLETTMGQQVKGVETFADARGTPLYYVVDLDPDGFVIVAADDLIEPIIGFASSGRFDPSTDNPLGALVSHDLPGRMARVKGIEAVKAQGPFLAARSKWERLKSAKSIASGIDLGLSGVSDVRVAPLTQTTWDQSTVNGNACYNYYTPPYAAGNSQNYVCGCVATAMAQLMRYWQYPVNGVGTASFTIYVTDVQQSRSLMGGNGAGGPYDWADMVLTPNSSTTLVQRQAIGALCADAGVSVSMQYNIGGGGESGAYMEEVQGALVQTFGFANAICGDNNAANIGPGLIGMVNPNLDAGCPVLLGISGDGGHAIVCDGYGYNLSTPYHHLNLGWSGSYTAWYNLPNIDAGGYTFNSVDACVYNAWTNGTGEIISGRITDGSGTPIAGVVVTATRTGGGTYTATNNTHGIYALARIPASSTYTVSASKTGYVFVNQIATTGQSTDYSATSGNQWAVDFVQTDSNNPTSFLATPVNSSRIDLSWGKNPSGDDVLVAWNTSATFGTPSGTYSTGDPIAGGGTVLYNGSATSVSHLGLSAGTTYFYRAWSVRSGPGYSTGVACSATAVHGVPFAEGFENAGLIPNGWTQEYVTGTVGWTFSSGNGFGYPTSAHGGSYNALLYDGDESDHKTKLVTPMIDFGAATNNAQLTFWQFMEAWPPDQDELRVYSKTSSGGSWTLLATYTTSVTSWTQRTIPLPNPNSTYFIAFEGNARYGYGVCIDDVAITAQTPVAAFYSFSLDTDPGWTRQGQWAFGHPTGQGGTSYGYPDPANGATGANVFGVNLSGDYSTTTGGPYYLVAGPLNFTGSTNVILQFQRWLNTDYQPFAYATIDVSSDGTTWMPYFNNGTGAITDSAWTSCQYDISATAKNQANVYVRWGYQIAGSAFAYSGWNVDDIKFLGLPPRQPQVGLVLSGTNLVINCANGTPNGTCCVLASTNLMLPLANWSVVATNTLDGNGCSGFTNGLGLDTPQRFFRLRLP
jgi:Peptidase C10 family/Spi protease inhibitor/Carboxypeptidase regulatory-like domain/MAM domain, meprin/A5/mu